jgi:asparagine synthase (glutamine-hydrolysing)
MCGIAGFYGYSGTSAGLSAELLDAMTAILAHRGPDGEGTWLCPEDGVGLGNCRLAIVDRSAAGAQPMSNADGTVRITFNGEIYNHRLLRAELEARGHTFRSRADTEAIVHAYEEWGLECFSRLVGMWGLALWDARQKRLVLARDRLGVKPLYYLVRNGQIRFASEIKSLFVDSALRPELDLESLALYLTFLVAPAPRTLFRGVHKLPPAHFLVVTPGQEPRHHAFWDPLEAKNGWIAQAATLPPEQLERFAVETIRELLRVSVQRRMMSDVPVGVFLSGGVDSGTVAALMRENGPCSPRAFSVGYDEPEYRSELPESRSVAHLLGCEYHEVVLTEQDLLDPIDDILYHLDEPIADWTSFPLYYLAREARRTGTPVILTGEGSDEIFGGYPGYLRAIRLARLGDSPLWRLPGAALAPRLLGPLFALAERVGGRGQGLRDDLERMARGEPAFIGLQIGVTELLKHRVLAGAGRDGSLGAGRPGAAAAPHIDRARAAVPPANGRAVPEEATEWAPLRWVSYLEVKQRLPEIILTRLDKMAMAHGVEGRVPFLDHELVEFVMVLPSSLRLRGGVTKYLLKRAAEAWLPADVVHRPKVAFGAPIPRWLRGRLGHHVELQIAESGLVRDGILRGDVIRAWIATHRAGRADHSQAIWSLYSVCRWYDLACAKGPSSRACEDSTRLGRRSLASSA